MEDIQEGAKILHTNRERVKNKQHFKRSMEFLLKSYGRDQNFYINLRGRTKIPSGI